MWTVTDYDGTARSLLVAYKEEGCRRLAVPLSAALATGLLTAWEAGAEAGRIAGFGGPVVVVPMPSSAAARRSRGEDPTRRLAAAAVRRLHAAGLPVTLVPALEQRPGVRDQAGLSAGSRMRNLRGALRLQPRALAPLTAASAVLLADDIVTTGATLAEASRVLLGAECPVVGAAVVGATQRRAAEAGAPQRRAAEAAGKSSPQPAAAARRRLA